MRGAFLSVVGAPRNIPLRRGSLGLRARPCRFSLLYMDETARLEAKDTGGKPYQPPQKKQ
ncbi:MAG: hypothetical protein M3371_07430 [Acidobacteriota bacterium]|nr:hypothetical protein [Acidobacteriota bacterium]